MPADVLWHMGDLHAGETWLVLLVAFGPFVVVALLVRRERLREAGAAQTGDAQTGAGETGAEEDQRSP